MNYQFFLFLFFHFFLEDFENDESAIIRETREETSYNITTIKRTQLIHYVQRLLRDVKEVELIQKYTNPHLPVSFLFFLSAQISAFLNYEAGRQIL